MSKFLNINKSEWEDIEYFFKKASHSVKKTPKLASKDVLRVKLLLDAYIIANH